MLTATVHHGLANSQYYLDSTHRQRPHGSGRPRSRPAPCDRRDLASARCQNPWARRRSAGGTATHGGRPARSLAGAWTGVCSSNRPFFPTVRSTAGVTTASSATRPTPRATGAPSTGEMLRRLQRQRRPPQGRGGPPEVTRHAPSPVHCRKRDNPAWSRGRPGQKDAGGAPFDRNEMQSPAPFFKKPSGERRVAPR